MSEIMGSDVRFPSQAEIIGLAVALLPFVCSFSSSSKTTVNGVVVEESSTDFVAIVAGLAAIGIGLYIATTLLPRTADSDRVKRIILTAAVLIVGVFQLLGRGFGAV